MSELGVNTLPEVEKIVEDSEEKENFNKTTHFRIEDSRDALFHRKKKTKLELSFHPQDVGDQLLVFMVLIITYLLRLITNIDDRVNFDPTRQLP